MSARTLRAADIGDLDAIMALETSIFVSDAWSRAGMRAELAGEHGHYLVAVDGGAVIGYAGLLAPRGSTDADIQTIAVAPEARRHGVGRALLRALLDEADARGAERVFLEVRADNPGAQELYRSLGFVSVGVRRGYYQPDGVDAVVMSRAGAISGGPASLPRDGGADGARERGEHLTCPAATPVPSEPANEENP